MSVVSTTCACTDNQAQSQENTRRVATAIHFLPTHFPPSSQGRSRTLLLLLLLLLRPTHRPAPPQTNRTIQARRQRGDNVGREGRLAPPAKQKPNTTDRQTDRQCSIRRRDTHVKGDSTEMGHEGRKHRARN